MLSAWANPVRFSAACMGTPAFICSRELVHAPRGVSERAPIPAAAVERAVFVERMLNVLVIEVTPNEDSARVTDAVSDCKAMTQRICTFDGRRNTGSCLCPG
jgi:hypothetical protein